ncbi:MAG: hypothetical protein U0074_12275 [Kouleothrix sp.]
MRASTRTRWAYACPNCGQLRPAPDFRLERLDLDGTSGSRLLLSAGARTPLPTALEMSLPLPGLPA